jgi:hypothetical protein
MHEYEGERIDLIFGLEVHMYTCKERGGAGVKDSPFWRHWSVFEIKMG